jgi:hypothetical protein
MQAPIVPQVPRERHRSVPGCLAGCFTQIFGALAFGCLVLLVVYVIVAPWGFYLGGQFHALPYWQGFGTMHGPGGDYAVFVSIYPSTRSGGSAFHLSGPSLSGSGIVCTPHGDKYNLRLTGTFIHKLGFRQTDTNGQAIGFSIDQRLNLFGTNATTRLSLYFHGTWQNPDLVVDDKGTVSQAFSPDGTWTPGNRFKKPLGQPLPLTLRPGSSSGFAAACAAVRK